MGFIKTIRLGLYLTFLVVVLALDFKECRAYTSQEVLYHQNYKNIKPGRKLLEGENVSEPINNLADDTVRVDPLDNFKKYRGGYDITNKHYWSSTIFTGIYGYAIGVLWLLCGVIYGIFLLTSNLCCTNKKRKLKRRPSCSKQCSFWPILLGIFFTFLAIVASGVVLGGSSRFHSRAKTVIDIIIDTADDASETIYNTTGAMKSIQDSLKISDENSEASRLLNSMSQRLDVGAADIQREAKKNRRLINKGLKIVYITTTVAISLNLIAVIALSVSGFLKVRRAFHLLIILCWLLTVICWISFGIYFFLEKFSGDTCIALEDFQQDPYNSSLGSILPCDELLSAKPVLFDVSEGIYNLVNQVNANISALNSSSFPTFVRVCNPFSAPPEYNYQPENCPANSIKIRDIPQVLKTFTCSNEDDGTCKEGEFISINDFNTVEAYTTSIQKLLNAFPGMENLVDCQVVNDAFKEILVKHCKPLKKYVQMVWAAMVVLSIIMTVFVLTWTTNAHHDRKNHYSEGSIKPDSAVAGTLEPDTMMITFKQ